MHLYDRVSQFCDILVFSCRVHLTLQFCDIMILLRSLWLDDGADVVSIWYDNHQNLPGVRARLDTIMMHLRCQNREGWTRPYYDTLRDDVGEVRFKTNRVNYRPLGFFGPNRNDFTFLYFATKTNRFDPTNAIDIAVERQQQVTVNPELSLVIQGRWNQQ